MKSLPIRLRLTLWNCLLFSSIIAILITVLYYIHKQTIYEDVDDKLTNMSLHVQEVITKQLNEGTPLQKVNMTVDSFSVNEFAVMIKGQNGELLESNLHPFLSSHQLPNDTDILVGDRFQTVSDENDIKLRVMVTPIYQGQMKVGYIEAIYSLSSIDHSLQKFKWTVIGLSVIGIGIAFIAAWFLAKKTLWRVDLIGKTAKAITSSQDFEQRVLYTGPPDELGQLTETFNQMLDSLEKAYKNQKRFLSDASHELRAPLTTIRGNLDILYKMKNIPETDKEEILEDIRNEAIRMSKLVSDLLSLARADAGQVYQKDIINLSNIATGVLGEMKSWEKRVKVNTDIKDQIKIWGDHDLIKQLFIIFLDNAIHYTPSNGSIYITITNDDFQHAVIKIKDTGIGVSTEEVPFIFDRFYRTETARKKSPDGTGLGLSIAKWIIDEHQGRIIVNSKLGEGTEFIIYLPIVN